MVFRIDKGNLAIDAFGYVAFSTMRHAIPAVVAIQAFMNEHYSRSSGIIRDNLVGRDYRTEKHTKEY